MRAFTNQDKNSANLLQTALRAAADEGRERQLRAEELVMALKRLEDRVKPFADTDADSRRGFRLRMMRAMLEVYYRK